MGLETISYCSPQLWNLVPTEIKDAQSLSTFKEKIKSWYCVTYILQSLTLTFSMVLCQFSASYFNDARYKLVL